MKKSKSYFKDMAFVRAIACLAVFLYHLNLLKGGYLAVNIFFVLSGFLSAYSLLKNDKFSFKEYYLKKLKNLYLPFIIIVFLIIASTSLLKDFNWFNMKPETTSVLFGYNNFWQLNANLDYFARHVSSPFMHLWYMGILLQFTLIFPFIGVVLKKLGEKTKTIVPTIILVITTILFTGYFYKTSMNDNIMYTYYNTFSRLFSLLFGVLLGFIHFIKPPKVITNKKLNRVVFYLYIILSILGFIFVDSTSILFPLSMILITIVTCRLIDYSVSNKKNLNKFDKIIKYLSDISYEIYLVQYPVIFLFQSIKINAILKVILIILLTVIISALIHYLYTKQDKKVFERIRYALIILLIPIVLFGGYKYVSAKDPTNELKELENKLAENSKMMEQKQAEYAQKLKQEQENLNNALNDINMGEEKLNEVVSNLSVTGVGDSVMLGAVDNLYQQFPNGYFDAAVSRTAWVANGILSKLANSNLLGEVVVLNLGANGDCPEENKIEIMNTIGNRKVFWLNTTNNTYINNSLNEFATKYDNLYIIDWYSISHNKSNYFIADGIHLTEEGKKEYTKTIYNSVYNVYLEEIKTKKETLMQEYENNQAKKISFIGNEVLVNAYNYIQPNFNNTEFIINNEYTYETLKNDIITRINEDTLNYNVVILLDNSLTLTKTQYDEIIDILKEYKIFIVSTNEINNSLINDNVSLIKFYDELKENDNYLLLDKIHLTTEGNKALVEILKTNLVI